MCQSGCVFTDGSFSAGCCCLIDLQYIQQNFGPRSPKEAVPTCGVQSLVHSCPMRKNH